MTFTTETLWLVIGFIGQGIFGMRFVVQWLASEIKKKSVIPMSFWYLSIVGSLVLLSYAIYRKDPIFILGFSLNLIIYVRNITLRRRHG
jgi:lipid-A-disaccharide synthase-like uncharacterized protein